MFNKGPATWHATLPLLYAAWRVPGQTALENLNQSSYIPNTVRGYTDHSKSLGEALKMKAITNWPFQLQSFYYGYPPARIAVWEVFLLYFC